MGVREGGSYVVDKAGTETLVERTLQPNPAEVVKPDETQPAPEVPSAPAATPVEAADDPAVTARRRGGPDTKPQE